MGEPNGAPEAGSAGPPSATAPEGSAPAGTAEPQPQPSPTAEPTTPEPTPPAAGSPTGTPGQAADDDGVARVTNLLAKLGLAGELDPNKEAMREEIIRINSGRLKAQERLAQTEARLQRLEETAKAAAPQTEVRERADQTERELEKANYDMAQVREKRLRDGDQKFVELAEMELWMLQRGLKPEDPYDCKIAKERKAREDLEVRIAQQEQEKKQQVAEAEMDRDFAAWAGKTVPVKDDPTLQAFLKEDIMATYYTAPEMDFDAFCADRLGRVQALVTHLTEKIKKSLLAEGQKRASAGVKPVAPSARSSPVSEENPKTIETLMEEMAKRGAARLEAEA
jgi:hypothetical protein